jgi:hypothetical protein
MHEFSEHVRPHHLHHLPGAEAVTGDHALLLRPLEVGLRDLEQDGAGLLDGLRELPHLEPVLLHQDPSRRVLANALRSDESDDDDHGPTC